jgi:ammonia channel protein AmtB
MITQAEVFASLAYFAVMYPVLVFTYQDEGANRRRSLLVVLTVAFAALAIKLVSFESFSFNVKYLDLIITNNSTDRGTK